ncbi:DUF5392 family protein [Salsuginibacillus kocurii]|uniref:DUF5392 family protein n=1 Tax=Salsuginibacillus kocurii TaxID=427078 RepID=UPI0003785D7F|nr:DUF5392 family protein [Salsuginibacillus kocurii]
MFPPKGASDYVKMECKKLQKNVAPILKKGMILSGIAIPLVGISLFNLSILLFSEGLQSDYLLAAGLLALVGAFGMALYKESNRQSRIMHEKNLEYMQTRIEESTEIDQFEKDRFQRQLNQEPAHAYQIFHTFLEKEEKKQNQDSVGGQA